MSNKDTQVVNLTIVGRGWAGLKQLYEAITKVEGPAVITSLDSKPIKEAGGLAAAGSEEFEFLTLNVPASKMSFFAEQPNHFVDYLKVHYPQYGADSYVPRHIYYNKYPLHILEQEAAKRPNITLNFATGVADNIIPQSRASAKHINHSISHKDKSGKISGYTTSDITVLALGNTPPVRIEVNARRHGPSDKRVIQSPLENLDSVKEFFEDLKRRGETRADIVIQGFGNTGIDLALISERLGQRYGIDVTIHAVQRHNNGIVKHPEAPIDRAKELRAKFINHTTTEGLWNAVKAELAQTAFAEGDLIDAHKGENRIYELLAKNSPHQPQDVVDALRSAMNEIWKNFSDAEKQKWKDEDGPDAIYRFFRNRVTRQTGELIEGLLENDKLKLYTGKITHISSKSDSIPLKVTLNVDAGPDQVDRTESFEGNNVLVLNAAGPDQSLEASPILSFIRNSLVGFRAIIRGFVLRDESPLVKTEDSRILIMPLSHIGTARLEHSGVREIRGYIEENTNKLLDLIEQVRTNKEIDARDNLVNKYRGHENGVRPERTSHAFG